MVDSKAKLGSQATRWSWAAGLAGAWALLVYFLLAAASPRGPTGIQRADWVVAGGPAFLFIVLFLVWLFAHRSELGALRAAVIRNVLLAGLPLALIVIEYASAS